MKIYLIFAAILASFTMLPRLNYYLDEMEKQNVEIRKNMPVGGFHMTKTHKDFMNREKHKDNTKKHWFYWPIVVVSFIGIMAIVTTSISYAFGLIN